MLYASRLAEMREHAAGLAPLDEEMRLQEEIFAGWRPGVVDRRIQTLRIAKLGAQRWRLRA